MNDNQINKVAFDRFSFGHLGVGLIMGALDVRESVAAAVAVGWEVLERPLKDKFPKMFPHASQDTMANAATDALMMYLGYKSVKFLFRNKT